MPIARRSMSLDRAVVRKLHENDISSSDTGIGEPGPYTRFPDAYSPSEPSEQIFLDGKERRANDL